MERESRPDRREEKVADIREKKSIHDNENNLLQLSRAEVFAMNVRTLALTQIHLNRKRDREKVEHAVANHEIFRQCRPLREMREQPPSWVDAKNETVGSDQYVVEIPAMQRIRNHSCDSEIPPDHRK